MTPWITGITHIDNYANLLNVSHGYGFRILIRTEFVKALYDSLTPEAQTRILLGRRVENIEMDNTGVRVTCQRGIVEEGDMLIGADGVRSQTRLLMESLRQNIPPTELAEKYQRPYLSTYRVLVAQIESLPGVPSNIKCDGVGYGVTTQLMYGNKISVFALYEKLETPVSDHHRYTDKDKVDMLERWGDLMVAPGYSVRDVQALCKPSTGMYDCEEGLVEKWHHERIVLVGDAVRKLDPHSGQGYNEGVTDLVVLVNGIRRMLLEQVQGDGIGPSTAAIAGVAAAYEAERMKSTGMVVELAKAFARMAAWLSWKDMVIAKYVQPYLPLNYLSLTYILGPLIREAPVLEWLEEPRQPPAQMAWKHHPKMDKVADEGEPSVQGVAAVSGASVSTKRMLVAGATAAAAGTRRRFQWR